MACSSDEQCQSGLCLANLCASFADAIPTADPGPNIVTFVGQTVTLDGLGSTDPRDEPLAYTWSLQAGPAASSFALTDTTRSSVTLTPDVGGIYEIQLVVNNAIRDSQPAQALVIALNSDGSIPLQPDGAPCAGNTDCESLFCDNEVCTANNAPTANPGIWTQIPIGEAFQLDGTGSSDPDGDPLTYVWSLAQLPVGSNAFLDDAMIARPTFTPDVGGVYVAYLTVNDSKVNSATIAVGILAVDEPVELRPDGDPCTKDDECQSLFCFQDVCKTNEPPIADAGKAIVIPLGDAAALDGSSSWDPEQLDLTYSWAINDAPAGSTATIGADASMNATFTPDLEGVYTLRLLVDDGMLPSLPAVVAVVAMPTSLAGIDEPCAANGECSSGLCFLDLCKTDEVPLADAGASQTVDLGALVTLDGSASSDPEGSSLTYLWSFVVTPGGSTAGLNDTALVVPAFIPDLAGLYTLNLTVDDGGLTSAPATVAIMVVDPGLLPNGEPCTDDTECQSDFCPLATCETNDPPTADAGPAQSVISGATATLDGSASADPEGLALTYSWVMKAMPAGSTATLDDATVVGPTFTADLDGLYTVELTVSDGILDSVVASVTVAAGLLANGEPCGQNSECISGLCNNSLCETNDAPIADAGPAQSVISGATVTLDGSASADPEGLALTYSWVMKAMPGGSTATLDDATVVGPTFTTDLDGLYTVDLTVNDGVLVSAVASVTVAAGLLANGQPCVQNTECISDFCDNSLCETNDPPIAVAGPFQSADVAQPVSLDGSGSSDPEGYTLTYAWTLTTVPTGSTAGLSDATLVGPTFTPDLTGIYTAELTVDDGALASLPSSVTIAVGLGPNGAPCVNSADCDSGYCTTSDICAPNLPPVADPGPLQNVDTNTVVTLDGSGSNDPESADLTYAWALVDVPPGSSAVLDDATATAPSFTADLAGDYTAQLIVNDGLQDSAPSYVVAIASPPTAQPDGSGCSQDAACLSGYCYLTSCKTNEFPIADAGTDQSAYVGDTVTFDASASSDPEGVTVTYLWVIDQAPAGSTATLADAATVSPTLVPDVVGIYGLRLVVDDGRDTSAADFVLVFVDPVPDPGPVDTCVDITTDTTWVAATVYRITCKIGVHAGATLTIEPGTEVRFVYNTGIHVFDGGALVADGTAAERIQLVSDLVATDWYGVRIDTGANGAATILRYLDVYDAGRGWNVTARSGAIVFQDVDGFTLEETTITDGPLVGVSIVGTATPGSWVNVTVVDSGGAPVEVQVNRAHTIGSGNYASADLNSNVILLYATGGLVSTTGTWDDHGVPYRWVPDTDFQGVAGSPAVLTLADNVVLEMNAGVRVRFLSYSGLIAIGNSIEFRATTPALAWEAIHFNGALGDQIQISGVTFAGAGNYWAGTAGIYFINIADPVIFENNVVHDFLNGGVSFGQAGALVDGSGSRLDGNAIYDTGGHPILMEATYLHTLGENNTFTAPGGGSPNVLQTVHVNPGPNDAGRTLTTSVTWVDPGIPYNFGFWVKVQGPVAGPTAVLTINPGVWMEFTGEEMQVLSNAALNAVGTLADPIVFSGPGVGTWQGLKMSGCVGDQVVLQHVHVLQGGNSLSFIVNGSLVFSACGPGMQVDDIVVDGGGGYGIVFSGSTVAPGSFTGNVVSNKGGPFLRFNASDMVNFPDIPFDPAISGDFTTGTNPAVQKVELFTYQMTLTSEATLVDLGVPYHVSNSLNIETFDVANPGKLIIRPNVTLFINGGNQFLGLNVGNMGQLDIQGEVGEEVILTKWSTQNAVTGIRVNFGADWDNIAIRNLKIQWGGGYDYYPSFPGGVNIPASIALRGATSGAVLENITTENPTGQWSLYFKETVSCPTLTNLTLLPPNGVGTECGTDGNGPDCCAAGGL